eukprot:scaffold14471_cov129-Cylindrotheca_fusiformis.AAC.1
MRSMLITAVIIIIRRLSILRFANCPNSNLLVKSLHMMIAKPMAWRSSRTANPILAVEAVVAAVEEDVDVVLVAATVAEN